MAVLTSGELQIVRAASRASSSDAAPVTCTVTSLVAPFAAADDLPCEVAGHRAQRFDQHGVCRVGDLHA